MLDARERHLGHLSGPWSIAELTLTEDDFKRLLRWARDADGSSIARAIARTDLLKLPPPRSHELHQGDAIVGLVLLALCAECTARLGSSGAPWVAIFDALGDCSLRRTLFTEYGAAVAPLKEAFSAAARTFWMRSGDLDDRTNNRWYQLLLLQAGLPRRDIAWLSARLQNASGRTFLIGALEAEVPTFRRAWDALERFRRRELSRGAARREIERCPFLRNPPDEILDAASSIASPASAPERRADPFSVSAHLEWPTAAAFPKIVLIPTFSTDECFGSRVVVSVDGIPCATFRRSAGVLAAFTGLPIARPPAARWTVVARGLGGDEEEATVELLPDDATMACFDRAGAPCAEDSKATRYVMAREPLVAGAGLRAVWLDTEALAVAEVEPGSTLTTIEGVRVWPSESVGPDIDASSLRVASCARGAEPGSLAIVLEHTASLRVIAARIGSVAFGIESEGSGITTVTGVMHARDATPTARLTVTLARDERRAQRTLRFRAFTAASVDGVWLTASATIDAARLAAGALRVSLGQEYEGCDARLVAGGISSPVNIGAHRPIALRRALGYGEPLILAAREPWIPGPRELLAAHVVSHGEVIGHEVRDGRVLIHHRLTLEPGADFWVLLWPRRGEPIAVPLDEQVFAKPGELAVDLPPDRDLRAVAVCYGNASLGASWSDNWSSDLSSTSIDAATLVKLVRLLALPVLDDAHRARVAARLRQLGVAATTVAMLESLEARRRLTLRGGRELYPTGDGDRWPHVVRALALDLRLSADDEVNALLGAAKERCVPCPVEPGIAATPEQLARLEEWKKMDAGPYSVFLRMLLAAGAVHPRDAVSFTAYTHRRSLALRLADAALGVSLDGQRVTRLRKAKLDARRRQLALVESAVAPAIAEAEAWATTATPPETHLREALIDERMFQRIQIELLEKLAYPPK